MPKTDPEEQAVTWRLHRDLLALVRAAAEKNSEPVLAFVARALWRELNDPRPPQSLAVLAKAAAREPPAPAPDWVVHHYDDID